MRDSAASAGLDAGRLERLVAAIPRSLFTSQRWFRSKGRSVARLALVDGARLDARFGAAPEAVLVVVGVEYADGDALDEYLLPLVLDAALPADDASAAVPGEPRDGDRVWARIVAAVAAGIELPAVHGFFRFEPTEAFERIVPRAEAALGRLDERRMRVEQTNTSVVLGERLIYKSYRLLDDGINPDVEVSAFLTERAGFEGTPLLAGAVHYLRDGRRAAAGMLQELVPARGDGWSWLLAVLASQDLDRALRGVHRIARLTAELHSALACEPEHPDFPVRLADARDAAEWRRGAEHQLELALRSISGEPRRRLAAAAPALRERFAALEDAVPGTSVTRIHGDYHLGQLLEGAERFWVIDFEGEPARPLAERRGLSSPLRDVAGMIRSLDYAVSTAAARAGEHDVGRWRDTLIGRLLTVYEDARGARADGRLLAAFEAEKACYEIRYEADNRPDWLWLPLDAVDRLATARWR